MRVKQAVILLLMTSACKSNADKALDGSDESTGQEARYHFPLWLLIVQTCIFALLVFLLIVWSIVKCYYSCRRRCNNIEEGQNRSETEPILRPGGHRRLAMRQPTPLGRRRGDSAARHQQNRETPSTETVNINRGGSRSNSTNVTIPQRTMTVPGILAPPGPVPVVPVHIASQMYDSRAKGLQRSRALRDLTSKALEVSYGTDGLVLANPRPVKQTSSSHLPESSRRVCLEPHSVPSCYSNIPPLPENLASRPFASGSLQKPAQANQDKSDAKTSVSQKSGPAKTNQNTSDAKNSIPEKLEPAKPNQDTLDAKKSVQQQTQPTKANQDTENIKRNQIPEIASPKKELQKSPTSIQNTSGESQSVTECFLGLKPLKYDQNGPRAVSDGIITAIPVPMTIDPICPPKMPPIVKSPVPLLHIPSSPLGNFYNLSGLRVPYHRPGFYLGGYESE